MLMNCDEYFICSLNRLPTSRKAKHLQWSGRIRPTYVAAGRYIGRTLARFKELRSKLCSTADRNSSLGWAICALKASWIASWTAPRTASCAAVRNVCESDSLARRRAGTRPYHFGSPGAAPRQTFFFSFSQSFRFLSPSPIFACFSLRLQQFLFLFSTVWVEISIFHETCLCVLTKNR